LKLKQLNWQQIIDIEKAKDYFVKLDSFVKSERHNFNIFPKVNDVFKAFELTPLEKLKVVIIGQDPYHKINQAHGLSFSVNSGIKTPPSLVNIYKEIKTDLNIPVADHGNLTHWAKQGVLLLNATLTVREGQPGSHQKQGWEIFTDEIIKYISENTENIVFLLWGNYAKSKKELINASKHLVLEAAHPSPLARGAFFGSKHFSKCNEFLISKGKTPIDWNLNEIDLFSVKKV
jgi:uracil-DNA glycosylase